MSLSFGALAINDVVAAVITVGFCEVCSSLYYGSPEPSNWLVFLNSFKVSTRPACCMHAHASASGWCLNSACQSMTAACDWLA